LLHLLAEFYAQTIVPPAVVDELDRGRAIGVDLPDVRAVPWLKIQSPQGFRGTGSRRRCDLGRTTEDCTPRRHKLTFTGTLGILLRAKLEGRIPRIEPFLERLGRLGFRLSARTQATVLKQAGE
jgi:hypothetical protein